MVKARAYYNEIDPAAAHILRAMIDADVIAPGDVDNRSIKDVQPDDLSGYANAHGHRCDGQGLSARPGWERLPHCARHPERNGTYWSDSEWIECHDGKARRAQPGIRFLVDGLPGRVDLWRVGGNAIVPQAAAEVIAAFMDVYGVPALQSMEAAA